MTESELTTTVTNEKAILRYMNGISEQNISLFISPREADQPRQYRSSIMRVEAENQQLVLHQLVPGDWKEVIQLSKDIEVTCHMQYGTIKFLSSLSPLDDSENSMYLQLPIPKRLSKKQLRSSFRVSLLKHKSEASLKLGQDCLLTGFCSDISMTGALLHLPASNTEIKVGRIMEQFQVTIANVLNLKCHAKISHVSKSDTDKLSVGLHFLELEPAQKKAIKTAIIKLERLNIVK